MNKEITACVIVIGNEILSGRTQDLNVAYIGKRCDELGIRLMQTRIIPDVEATIVATINECRRMFTYIFTTGGIGPTHDDITAASVALAFAKKIERRAEAVEVMDNYYESGKLTEARLKMADVPADSILIDNPVSAAPGFQLENVFVMAGVPIIMQAMFEGIVDRLAGGKAMLMESVATNLGESALALELSRLQDAYTDVSIGSYPYFKKGKVGVNLVIRSIEQSRLTQLKKELQLMIEKLGGKIVD
ncbi:MAG: competence/damage-inducible protein A [Gammaproteobacteria bacterium]|nr:competence/damage-inducible protein A [Gammaproteobacteria bacterium]